MAVPKPDYLSRDYTGLRQSLMTYAQQRLPEWQPGSEGDFGVVMLELFAYMGDIVSYYTDRAQFENYLPTATQRDSILNLAFMLGYTPNSGTPARGTVPMIVNKGGAAVPITAGLQVTTNRVETLDGPVVFEVDEDVEIPANPAGTATPIEVPVTEGATETFQYIGESTGQPNQFMLLPHTGVYRETIQVFTEDWEGSTKINEGSANEITAREWVRVDHLLEGDKDSKVFETRMTSTSTNILFGDDINGAIPATGLKVYATYRHGVGAAGNMGTGQVRMINSKGETNYGRLEIARDASGAYLSSATTGGADAESNDSIRLNAPRVYRTQERVVTERDFVEMALGTEGVSSANAVIGTFTSVTLFVTGPDGGPAGDALKQAVLDRLDGKTLAGVTVTIGAPTYVPINFGTSAKPIVLEVRKGHSLKNVKAAARREIRALIGQLEFGDSLGVNQAYRALNAIAGVKNVDIDIMVRADEPQTGTVRITPRAWEMMVAGSIYINAVRVDNKKGSN